MNYLLLTQLFLALTAWLPLCAVALAPLALGLLSIRRTVPRIGVALVGGYLLLAAVTGLYAYTFVPADYTRAHRLTLAPAASALNEQHGPISTMPTQPPSPPRSARASARGSPPSAPPSATSG